jgi:hypothetical protein
MFGFGLNVPTATTVLLALLLSFSLHKNITSWKVLQPAFGAAAKDEWAKMVAKYKAWRAMN